MEDRKEIGPDRYSVEQNIKKNAAEYLNLLDCYGKIEKEKLDVIERVLKEKIDSLARQLTYYVVESIAHSCGYGTDISQWARRKLDYEAEHHTHIVTLIAEALKKSR